jgi:diguanylate cyclase (GGDEF)-like protein/PAS domain S-box-containing protein
MNRRIVTQGAIAFVVLSGVMALLGWCFKLPLLTSGFLGSAANMKANTALGMVLSGLSLSFLQDRYRAQKMRRVAQGMALGVLILGGLTLIQYLLGWNFGIDQWLFQDRVSSSASLPPGRMGLNTAINFVLVGAALLLFSQRMQHSIRAAHILSCVVASLAMTALVGYLFDVNVFFKLVAQATVMSPNTSVTFIGLCIGLFCIRPRQGLMKAINSSLSGGLMARHTLPWAISLPVGLGWLVQQGVRLQAYDVQTGYVLEVVAMQIALSILIWWSAKALNQIDDVRQQAEADLFKANENRIKVNERAAILQQETQRLEAVVNAQQAIIQYGSNAEEVMMLMAEQAQQLTRADGAVIELVEDDELVYQGVSGTAAAYVGLRLKKNASLSGHCVETSEILNCPDVERDSRVDINACRRIGVASMIVVPLLQKEGCIGVLKVLSASPNSFTEQDIQTLRLIAVFLTSALELQQSEQELRALFEAMHDLVLVRDMEGRCLKILSNHSKYLILPVEAMLHRTLHETMPKAQADLLLNGIQQSLKTGQTVVCEYSLDIRDKYTWFSTNISPLSNNTVTLVIRNISDRKKLEQELFREKELAQVTLHSIGDAVITTDADGKVQYFNPVAEALTGWSQKQACGMPLTTVFNIIHETTREPAHNPIEKAIREGRIVGLANHTLLISRAGREIPIEDSAAPIRDRSGNLIGAVLVFHDVTQTRSLTRQLSWEATHDPLTQLTNRREFEYRVEQALKSAQSQGCTHALCYIDLDQFKIVNDTCGHGAGDELLRQVTALLQAQVRKTDVLARLGGDEFGVLLHECPLPQALRVANEMRECIQGFRFAWQDQAFKIGASIGLMDINSDSESLSNILSAADVACYAAKNKGRNRVHVYQSNDQDLLQQRGEMQWATRLTQALEEDSFCLYYQPIAAIAIPQSGEHYEVLLRLRDEEGNIVAPMAFIPAAERYGLMHLIDRWVIRTLFSTQGHHYRSLWQQHQLDGSSCNSLYAVNLSGASLNDDQFMEFLHEQFAQHQIPPSLICFEITETMAISNLTKASQFIHELRDLGCRFALDDFGSGMSSFGYLKNLAVDYLKIDGGFVRNIINDPLDEAMVESMTRIGHVMGLQIIAEFVENDAISARIKTLGIDYAQGYGIAKPQPLL